MSENDFYPQENSSLPRLNLMTMFRLGLFQIGLGMMSVLLFGVLNRILIKELAVPGTIATIILALTLFVSPSRILFGQLSDTKKLFGYHRTGYVWLGAGIFSILAFIAVQVMWKVGDSLKLEGWTINTYFWMAILAIVFAGYGLALSSASTPFATLLVDVSDEDNRSKLIGVDWSMLIFGTIIGAISIGVILKKLTNNSPITEVQTAINNLFFVVPLVVFALAIAATWGVEKKYSRYHLRSTLVDQEEKITFNRAIKILTSSGQTKVFFSFLLLMTLGLFMQDTILETYGGDVFNMGIGQTANLNAFWGSGTLLGLIMTGFLLIPKIGKRQTTKIGCLSATFSLILVICSGFTGNEFYLKIALLIFGLASGIVTTGALTLMLDLTAAETAGTFIGAWGLSQALARGMATIIGGTLLDVGKKIFSNIVLTYSLIFALQGGCMLLALILLSRVNIQEFRTTAKEAIATVITNDLD
jgi:MFS transporter, BCD family, chlorophyll transporter